MSKVSLCNEALLAAGEANTITSLEPPDGSAHAQICAALFDPAFARVTEARHWTFADKRVALTKITLASPTADATTNLITTGVAHGLAVNNPVSLVLLGSALPAPLEEDTIYYVAAVTSTTFSLSEEIGENGLGGSVIDLTTNGTGQFRVLKESDRSGYAFMYALPTDCLTERNIVFEGAPDDWPDSAGSWAGLPCGSVSMTWNSRGYAVNDLGYGGQRIPFKRAINVGAEQVIYTNLENAELVYSAYIDNTAQWPPFYKKAGVYELAADIAGSLRRDARVVDALRARAQQYISEASRIDAQRAPDQSIQRYPWNR